MAERPPVVVKIGGGLLHACGLEGLRQGCAEALEIAAQAPVVVVPGGGPFADAVRALDARLGLADELAHALAIQAMDQLGLILRWLMPGAVSLSSLTVPRGLGVLLASQALVEIPDVPSCWTVSSDSLAVLAAAAIGASEVVLLKPVAGILARWPSAEPPLRALSADELEALQARGGGLAVDRYLPEAVRRSGLCVVVRSPRGSGTRVTPR